MAGMILPVIPEESELLETADMVSMLMADVHTINGLQLDVMILERERGSVAVVNEEALAILFEKNGLIEIAE